MPPLLTTRPNSEDDHPSPLGFCHAYPVRPVTAEKMSIVVVSPTSVSTVIVRNQGLVIWILPMAIELPEARIHPKPLPMMKWTLMETN